MSQVPDGPYSSWPARQAMLSSIPGPAQVSLRRTNPTPTPGSSTPDQQDAAGAFSLRHERIVRGVARQGCGTWRIAVPAGKISGGTETSAHIVQALGGDDETRSLVRFFGVHPAVVH